MLEQQQRQLVLIQQQRAEVSCQLAHCTRDANFTAMPHAVQSDRLLLATIEQQNQQLKLLQAQQQRQEEQQQLILRQQHPLQQQQQQLHRLQELQQPPLRPQTEMQQQLVAQPSVNPFLSASLLLQPKNGQLDVARNLALYATNLSFLKSSFN